MVRKFLRFIRLPSSSTSTTNFALHFMFIFEMCGEGIADEISFGRTRER